MEQHRRARSFVLSWRNQSEAADLCSELARLAMPLGTSEQFLVRANPVPRYLLMGVVDLDATSAILGVVKILELVFYMRIELFALIRLRRQIRLIVRSA